jgi:hypothetical protein
MRYADINTSDYRDGEVLFFIRIKGAEHFFNSVYGGANLAHFFGHLTRRPTLSEYKNASHVIDIGTIDASDLEPKDYSVYRAVVHDDLGSVIARCRGLREISYAEARNLVLRTSRWARLFFESHSYRLLVLHIIDNYVTDVIVRMARYFGIKVMVMSEWFIQPYRRHTLYGELCRTREPTDDEVDRAIEYFSKPTPAFWLVGITRAKCLTNFFYLWIRYKILFLYRYVWGFKVKKREAYEFRFAFVLPIRIRDLFIKKYFKEVSSSEIHKCPEKYVVIPLHTFPEANVDYWMTDWRDADYYCSLYEVISFFRAEGCTVLLKEHPGFLYQRHHEVYRTLSAFENVRLIDPFSPSAQLLNLVPLIVVWHGTMGIEGVMGGRRVVVYDKTYFNDGSLLSYKDYKIAEPISEVGRKRFLRRLLGGVEPGV